MGIIPPNAPDGVMTPNFTGGRAIIKMNNLVKRRRKGILFVVSAPSGAGKTSLCKRALSAVEGLKFSVSHTTRPARPGETEGKDYHFVSEEEFDRDLKRGDFAEWAVVHGHRYGTSLRFLLEEIYAGNDILLDIDVQGASQIKRKFLGVYIFIYPPSMEVLEQRIKMRKAESEDEMRLRLEKAREEMNHYGEYDYLIVNDNLEGAAEELKAIIVAERCRVNRLQIGD